MKYLILVFCLFAFTSQAQQGADLMFDVKEIGLYKGTPTYYLLGDSVLLREEATTKSAIVTMLPIGEKLTLHARSTHIDTIKGIKCHWYQVKTAEYKGWVWGGFIAQKAFGSRANADIKFVVGIDRIKKEKSWRAAYYQIRAIKNKKLLSKFELKSTNIYLSVKLLGGKGMAVDDVITMRNVCESCGCMSIKRVIFWDDHRFHHAANLESTADAWASSGQHFIYPTDMEGKAGHIIKVQDDFVDTDDEKIITRKRTVKYFIWKENQLQLQQEKTTTKIYYQEW